MNVDLSQWLQFGIAGVMLGVFVKLHFGSLKDSKERELAMVDQLKLNRAECRDDTKKLVQRIQEVEDRHNAFSSGIAQTCAEALKMHADSGKHPTIKDRP